MPSARRKRARNKKYYIQNIKELKTKARSNYSADPEKKPASKASYSADPTKKKLLLKLPLKQATVLIQYKRRLLHVPTQRKAMPKTLRLKFIPHKHTMQTTKKAGVLTEEPGMRWWSQSMRCKNSM